jgi:hypothetical protein
MYYYTAFGLNIHSEILLPELAEGDRSAAVAIHIQKGTLELPRLKKTQIYRRGIRASFGKDEDDTLYLDWAGIASFKAIQGHTLIVEPHTTEADLISLFTVSEALGLVLFQKGYFLLHASSVAIGDEAWCFMGNPGAGKSSTAAAFIKAGCRLLSDDLTAITFDEDGLPVVIPAYPQLKIWDRTVAGLGYNEDELEPVSEGVNKYSYKPKSEFSHKSVPLRKAFFLHKARNKHAWQYLNATEIPTELLRNFPLPIDLLDADKLKAHFMQSFQCAKAAEMIRKRRPEGFSNLESWVEDCIREQLIAG